jgi:molecular chaperone DnaJ
MDDAYACYACLGLTPNCSDEDLRKAYRRLAMEHHPDKTQGDKVKEETFKHITHAYGVLSDQEQRRQYDLQQQLMALGLGCPSSTPSPTAAATGRPDILHFACAMELPTFLFATSPDASPPPAPAEPIVVPVQLSLTELYEGCVKTVQFEFLDACRTCGGSGAQHAHDVLSCMACGGTGGVPPFMPTCLACGGTGRMIRGRHCSSCEGEGVRYYNRALDVRVPGGVPDGYRQLVPGKGGLDTTGPRNKNAASSSSMHRDLVLLFQHALDPMTEVRDQDVHLTVPVTLAEVMHGVQRTIQITATRCAGLSWVGYRNPQLPLRVEGLGLRRGPMVGDLCLSFSVQFPAAVTTEQQTTTPN